jgi:crossover junction endodeoxyribonuclease RuvC
MRTMGIDIATHTGMVSLVGEEAVGKQMEFPSQRGCTRLQSIARESRRFLEIWKPELVVIEGFGFATQKSMSSLALLVQCATVIQLEIHSLGIEWWTCTPSTLKKWTTGNGAASKDLMAAKVFERWGYRSPSTDLVDAYALSRLGQLGPEKLAALKGLNRGL